MKAQSWRKHETRSGWLMAGPAILLLFAFWLVPFFLGFGFSFTNQRLVSPNPTEFVGMRHFRSLLTVRILRLEPLIDEQSGEAVRDASGEVQYPLLRDITRNNPDNPQFAGMYELYSWYRGATKVLLLSSDVVFIRSLINTILFVLVVAPVQGFLALFLALILNIARRGIYAFRTIYFMPVVISIVVVSLLWRFIYDGTNGLLNTMISSLSFGRIPAVDWLGNPSTALFAIIMMSIWQAVGFHMIIWLAGLQSIPSSRYEAAAIDGANSLQQFRYITWPGLHNTAVFVFIIITMQAFTVFSQIDVMTNGGPLDSTQTVIFQAVVRGYRKQNIANGAAVSVIYFLFVLVISLVQRRLLRGKQ